MNIIYVIFGCFCWKLNATIERLIYFKYVCFFCSSSFSCSSIWGSGFGSPKGFVKLFANAINPMQRSKNVMGLKYFLCFPPTYSETVLPGFVARPFIKLKRPLSVWVKACHPSWKKWPQVKRWVSVFCPQAGQNFSSPCKLVSQLRQLAWCMNTI